MRRNNHSRFAYMLVGGVISVCCLLLIQFLVVMAQEPIAASFYHQGSTPPVSRPTLDPTRQPLTSQPLATIRTELTATAIGPHGTPTSDQLLVHPQVQMPQAGTTAAPIHYSLFVTLALLCCATGLLVLYLEHNT